MSIFDSLKPIKKSEYEGLSPWLILGIEREATKRLSGFLTKDKEYIAKIRLGAISDTYDREGRVVFRKVLEEPSEKKVKKVLKSFLGKIEQKPPVFSAKKIKGKKLYELARKGIKVKIKPQRVEIYKIDFLSYKFPYLKIKVSCSSGTYIRSLAHDIGGKLSCGGYLEELCRTKIGEFELRKAVRLSRLSYRNWQNFLFN